MRSKSFSALFNLFVSLTLVVSLAPSMSWAGENPMGGGSALTTTPQGNSTPQKAPGANTTAISENAVATIGTTGYSSLDEAIAAANTSDTIVLQKNVKGYFPIENKTLTIDLNGKTVTAAESGTVYNSYDMLRAFVITGGNVTIKNGTITGANASSYVYANRVYTYWAGAVTSYKNATVTLDNLTITGNEGNVIHADSGTLNINNCKLVENSGDSVVQKTSDYARGVVHTFNGAVLNITNTEISGLTGTHGMAPIYIQGGAATITGCDIKNNTAYYAGGIYFTPSSNAKLTLNDTTISENTGLNASTGIGGLYANIGTSASASTVELIDSAIYNNTSKGASMYGADIQLAGNSVGMPAANAMVDHGVPLTDYVYKNGVDGTVYADGIPSAKRTSAADQYSVIKPDGADGAWQYGTNTYRTLAEAAAAYVANNGEDGTIQLLMDVTEWDALPALGTAEKQAVIDLGGFTVTGSMATADVFKFSDTAFVAVQNGTIEGGKYGIEVRGSGSAVALEKLTIRNSASYALTGTNYVATKRTTTVESCTFEGNNLDAKSYAVYITGDLEIRNSTFMGNGGGVRTYGASVPLFDNVTFTANLGSCLNAAGNTIAAPFTGATMEVKNCTFEGNQLSGGNLITLNAKGKTINFENCKVIDNVGAVKTIYIANPTVVNFNNCEISGNVGATHATDYVVAGIAGYSVECAINLVDTVVKSNVADTDYESKPTFSYISAGGIFCVGTLSITGKSAVYNNRGTSSASPDLVANDIYLPPSKATTIPAASDMVDGSFDFSRYVWEDASESDYIYEAISSTQAHTTFLTAVIDPEKAYEAQIGETKYKNLKDAFDAAQDGDLIEIIITQERPSVRILTPPKIEVNKNVVLDLNGIRLESPDDTQFVVKNGAKLAIKDSVSDSGDIWQSAYSRYDTSKMGAVLQKVAVEEGSSLDIQSTFIIPNIVHQGNSLSVQKPILNMAISLSDGCFVELGSDWNNFATNTTLTDRIVLTLDPEVIANLNNPDLEMDDVVVVQGGGSPIKSYVKVDGIDSSVVRKVYADGADGGSLVLRKAIVGVYLDGVAGKAIVDGADGTLNNPVKTFEEAHKLLIEQTNAEGIIVKNVVTVDADTSWDLADCEGRAKLIRWDDNLGNLVKVVEGGALTLTNIVLDGQGDDGVVSGAGATAGDGSLIYVAPKGALTVGNGAVLRNNFVQLRNAATSCGGAIYSAGEVNIVQTSSGVGGASTLGLAASLKSGAKAMETVQGGTISRNRAVQGGGIYQVGKVQYHETDYAGKLIMSGGAIEANQAQYPDGYYSCSLMPAGGGIMLAYGADMCLTGGRISRNVSYNIGGGISLGTTGDASTTCWTKSGTTTLAMYGDAVIDGNNASSEGGGIYVQIGAEAYVSEGVISNNRASGFLQYGSPEEVPQGSSIVIGRDASHGGGGIYVNGCSTYYYNSRVKALGSNYADYKAGILYLSDAEVAYNSAGYSGSAYAFCASGDAKLFELHGGLIHDNINKYGIDVVMTTVDHQSGQRVGQLVDGLTYYVTECASDGTPYNWQTVRMDGDNSMLPVVSTKQIQYANQRLGLHTDLSEETTDLSVAKSQAKVKIINNSAAYYGGGIGSNGSVRTGFEIPKVDVVAQKKWDDAVLAQYRPETIKLILQRKAEGQPDTAYEDYETALVQDDEGLWQVRFRDLPAYKTYAASTMPTSEACPDCSNGADVDTIAWEYRIVEDGSYQPLTEGSVIWKGEAAESAEDQEAAETLNEDAGKTLADVYAISAVEQEETTRPADENYTFGDTIPVKNFRVTNTIETGSLKVSKMVTGAMGDKTKEFTFKVTLETAKFGGIKLSGVFGDMEFADNIATFTLADGQSKTATGLPAGIKFTVVEEDYSADGYTTISEGAEGTLAKDQTLQVAYVNDKPKTSEPVDVVLKKHLVDALIHPEEFSFGLYDEESKLLDTVHTTLGTHTSPETDGYSSYVEIAFKDLEFSVAGTYNYTIREHMDGTTEVKEGDEFNLQGFESGFYKGGVKYDDKTYAVVIDVVDNEGVLVATVSYPGSADNVELFNEYSEEYVEIDGNDEHPNDGLHEDEPSKENKGSSTPKTNKPPAAKQSTTPKTGAKTGDTTPVAPLSTVALLAAGAMALAITRRRKHE